MAYRKTTDMAYRQYTPAVIEQKVEAELSWLGRLCRAYDIGIEAAADLYEEMATHFYLPPAGSVRQKIREFLAKIPVEPLEVREVDRLDYAAAVYDVGYNKDTRYQAHLDEHGKVVQIYNFDGQLLWSNEQQSPDNSDAARFNLAHAIVCVERHHRRLQAAKG
jgi:hypothetical protein